MAVALPVNWQGPITVQYEPTIIDLGLDYSSALEVIPEVL